MIITREFWKILVRIIEGIEDCPVWLKSQAGLSWESISQLPALDEMKDGQSAIPNVEKKLVTLDYIEFLKEQIRLNSRGKEWSDVLEKCLNALEPFIGQDLVVSYLYFKPHVAILRFHYETKEIIHVELF